jgi:class 3 adenylate cyclase
MFCDLVGSASLASRLDAEDWRSLVNAYFEEASASLRELDAFDSGESCGSWRPRLAE